MLLGEANGTKRARLKIIPRHQFSASYALALSTKYDQSLMGHHHTLKISSSSFEGGGRSLFSAGGSGTTQKTRKCGGGCLFYPARSFRATPISCCVPTGLGNNQLLVTHQTYTVSKSLCGSLPHH